MNLLCICSWRLLEGPLHIAADILASVSLVYYWVLCEEITFLTVNHTVHIQGDLQNSNIILLKHKRYCITYSSYISLFMEKNISFCHIKEDLYRKSAFVAGISFTSPVKGILCIPMLHVIYNHSHRPPLAFLLWHLGINGYNGDSSISTQSVQITHKWQVASYCIDKWLSPF